MTDWKTRTKLVHSGTRRSQYGEMSEAIFLTQGFVYESAEEAEARFIERGPDEFIYARYGNPTVRMFEERVAAIEGTEDAFATASGMAAVNGALTALLKAGDHVVAARALFGSCLYVLENSGPLRRRGDAGRRHRPRPVAGRGSRRHEGSFPRIGVEPDAGGHRREVGGRDRPCARARPVIVDNVFATPTFSKAVALGADVVVYSATKHIDGGGRCLGGVVCGTRHFIRKVLEPYLKHTGAALSPFNAWVMLKGMETLDLRVRAQAATALEIAEALEGHPKLARVIYPGLPGHAQHRIAMEQMGAGGTVVTLEVAGGQEGAFRFLNALGNREDIQQPRRRQIDRHPSGDDHPSAAAGRAEARELGITPGLVRFSVGIEDAGDLLADLRAALDAV